MEFKPEDKFRVTTVPWPAGQPVPTSKGGAALAYTDFLVFHDRGVDFDFIVAGRTDGAISR